MQKNKVQRYYAASLARFQTVNGQIEAVEKVHLADKGIVNADGFVPEALWQIDDENIFEKANADVSKLIEESGLEKKYLEVQKNLTAAEDRLIVFGLSIIPDKIRPLLEENAKASAATRKKILELASKLDVSTVTQLR